MLANGNTTLFGLFDSGVPSDVSGMISIIPNNTSEAPKVLIGDAGSGDAQLTIGGNILLSNTGSVDSYINAGNVGIGTTSPRTTLEVSSTGAGGISISQDAANSTNSGRLFFETDTASEGFSFLNSNGLMTIRSQAQSGVTSGTTRVSINGGGDVGIGTTSQAVRLAVSGSIYASGKTAWNGGGVESNKTDIAIVIDENDFIYTRDDSANLRKLIGKTNTDLIQIGMSGTSLIDAIDFYSGATPLYRWYSNATEIMRLNATGLGIGTTSPQEELEVKSTSFSTVAVNTDRNTAGENIGSFAFYGHNNATIPENLLYSRVVGSMTDVTDGSEDGDIYFQQIKDGSIGETFRVKSNGNVGIGTTSPAEKLEVEGSVNNDDVAIKIENTFDDNTPGSAPAAALILTAASNNGYIRLTGSPADVASEHILDIGSTNRK